MITALRKLAAWIRRDPLAWVFWTTAISMPVAAWLLPLTQRDQQLIMGLALTVAVLIVVVYHTGFQRFSARSWVVWLGIGGAILTIAAASYILEPYGISMSVVYMAVVSGAGLLVGGTYAIVAAFFAAGVEFSSHMLRGQPLSGFGPLFSLEIIPILINAIMISALAGALQEKVQQVDRKNRDLTLLLKTSLSTGSSTGLHQELQGLAVRLVDGLPCDCAQVYLLSQADSRMELWAAHPGDAHSQSGDASPYRPAEALPLDERSMLPRRMLGLERLVQAGQPVNIDAAALRRLGTQEGIDALLPEKMQSACLSPLKSDGQLVGVLLLGFRRPAQENGVDQASLDLLHTLSMHVGSVIISRRLTQAERKQSQRLALLNEVARAISSTIAMDDLLELLYSELNRAIPSDTYYVALYDEAHQELDIQIFYDEGQRYPPVKIPIGVGLGSYVVTNKTVLHIRQYSREAGVLGLEARKIGADRISESWMGVPLMVGEQCLGMLAIAAYLPFAFDEDDQTLLVGVAAQAALALQNARAFTALQYQARHDSLTGALNHMAFLDQLDVEVAAAVQGQRPVTLIMMDIDYFKDYNDIYGHHIGDRVLVEMVKAIQAHIKKSDAVGRWGGEEFAVLLPGATSDQALHVANRIRTTLASMQVMSPDGARIPPPTASQGLACYPEHVENAADLVEFADKALYDAKHSGRDRVRVAMHQLPSLLPPDWPGD